MFNVPVPPLLARSTKIVAICFLALVGAFMFGTGGGGGGGGTNCFNHYSPTYTGLQSQGALGIDYYWFLEWDAFQRVRYCDPGPNDIQINLVELQFSVVEDSEDHYGLMTGDSEVTLDCNVQWITDFPGDGGPNWRTNAGDPFPQNGAPYFYSATLYWNDLFDLGTIGSQDIDAVGFAGHNFKYVDENGLPVDPADGWTCLYEGQWDQVDPSHANYGVYCWFTSIVSSYNSNNSTSGTWADLVWVGAGVSVDPPAGCESAIGIHGVGHGHPLVH